MSKRDAPKVLASIILLSYNSLDDLAECIPSIIDQSYENYEIIIMDNSPTDECVEFVKSNYPSIKCIKTGSNLGYSGGNNNGQKYASGEYIVFMNPDTVADRDWLTNLIKPFETDREVSLTTSKVLMYGDKSRINACGIHTYFTGLGFCRGLNMPSTKYSKPEEVSSVSGCSFAIRSEAFNKLNGFDPDFFLYIEDVDLSWRARLYGYKIMFVPDSILYHKFKLTLEPWKEYYLERNRQILLLKNYSLRMLLFTSPALIVTEIITWGHAIIHGMPFIKNKAQSYLWLFTHIGHILDKRHLIQNNRKIDDRDFFRLLEWEMPFDQLVNNRIAGVVASLTFNSFFKVYYNIIKSII